MMTMVITFMDNVQLTVLFDDECQVPPDGSTTLCSWKMRDGELILMGHKVVDRIHYPLANIRYYSISNPEVKGWRKVCRRGEVRTTGV